MTQCDESLDPKYRMPRHFGPAAGPRDLPADRRSRRYEKELVSYAVSARTDAKQLIALLPDGLAPDGEVRLEVCILSFRKIGWLAGRGYYIIMVRIPARWIEGATKFSGYFVLMVWENMADPIITGREELGWPKIFTHISVSDPLADSAPVVASMMGIACRLTSDASMSRYALACSARALGTPLIRAFLAFLRQAALWPRSSGDSNPLSLVVSISAPFLGPS